MEAYVMDAFSASLFGGNQAGVVLPDRPLTDAEMEAVRKVQDIFRFMHRIACTACRCCTDGCPQHLPIRKLLEDVAKEFETKE